MHHRNRYMGSWAIKYPVWTSVILICLAGCSRSEEKKEKSTASPATQSAVFSQPAPPSMFSPTNNEAIDKAHLEKVQKSINDGIAFLLTQRNADGGWGFAPGQSHPALTAMTLKAILQHPQYTIESPVVSDGLKCLLKFRQADGGFYVPQEGNANYVTSVAVMALAAAKDPQYKTVLSDAVKFLRGRQITPGSKTPEGEEVGEDHPYTGGVSYGQHGRA